MRPAWAGGLFAVLAGCLVLSAAPADAGTGALRPSPKPTAKVPPGHATPSATSSPTVQATPSATATPADTPSAAAAVTPAGTPVAPSSPRAFPGTVVVAPPAPPRLSVSRPAAPDQPVTQHQPQRDDERLSDVAHSFARVATASPQLPLGVIVAVLLFLVVQSRIDRKDPKLAITDASSSVELEFRPVRRPLPEPERRHVPLTIRPVAGRVAATDVAVNPEG